MFVVHLCIYCLDCCIQQQAHAGSSEQDQRCSRHLSAGRLKERSSPVVLVYYPQDVQQVLLHRVLEQIRFDRLDHLVKLRPTQLNKLCLFQHKNTVQILQV